MSNYAYYENIDTNKIKLDTDDRYSYGPETVKATDMSLTGYKYYVHDYTTIVLLLQGFYLIQVLL